MKITEFGVSQLWLLNAANKVVVVESKINVQHASIVRIELQCLGKKIEHDVLSHSKSVERASRVK